MSYVEGRGASLTALCPIRDGVQRGRSYWSLTRRRLDLLPQNEDSPFAKVPNTYMARLFVLNSLPDQGGDATMDLLSSPYLVFAADIYGDPDTYLAGVWTHARDLIGAAWEFCYSFDTVRTADEFVAYVSRCRVETMLYVTGAPDEPLAEQLKALYLKQEFSRFAFESAGKPAETLQRDFREFVRRTRPKFVSGPTWKPGASRLADVIVDSTLR